MNTLGNVLQHPTGRLAAALAAAAMTAWPAAAHADGPPPPEHGQIRNTVAGEDSETCAAEGVTFHYDLIETINYTVFFNKDGSQRRIVAHHSQQVTFTANGKTLRENDHWTNFIYPDGSVTLVGSTTHVQGDHGLVLRDAGRFVVDANGEISFRRRTDPTLYRANFCSALLP